jgi:hypothetical protein
VAGAVAEVAPGKTWAELVDEIYVQPCGLDVLAYNNPWFQLPFNPVTFGYPPEFAGDPSTLTPTENSSITGGAYTMADDFAALDTAGECPCRALSLSFHGRSANSSTSAIGRGSAGGLSWEACEVRSGPLKQETGACLYTWGSRAVPHPPGEWQLPTA